ncbi:UNKNOWN [Stylonychia lemnae]|uniref:Uncharacterized protein n=1 Tax=Stylonychia lemnae TaxID=5949 RepID=A0A078AM56_STYLE|nr:UNKNOWN [Stylonychia lemnae]|eukprot:CDW83304.1 UNKNOWN [Stylonychia lemnae]
MQNQNEVGMASLIMNSKSHYDQQQKQYIRNVSNSPQRNPSIHTTQSPAFQGPKAKGLNNSFSHESASPFTKNAQMILNDYGHPMQQLPQQMNNINQQYKPVTPLINNQQQFQILQPIQSQQYLGGYVQNPQMIQQQSFQPQQQNMIYNNNLNTTPQFQDNMNFGNQIQPQQQNTNQSFSNAPPSGMPNQLNESFVIDNNYKPTDSFKNPWTTKPRPMNGFMDLNPIVYERQEKEKQDLQKVLQEQIEEKKKRQDLEKRKKLMEDQYYEEKIARDRMELAMKEQQEREAQQQKIQKIQEQNQQLYQERQNEVPPPKSKRRPPSPKIEEDIKVELLQQPDPKKDKKEKKEKKEKIKVQTTINDQQLKNDLNELSMTFKGELESMRQVIQNQDGSLKDEVKKLLDYQKQTDQDRNRAIQEIQKLREEFLRQQEIKQEQQWDSLSRSAHWSKFKEEDPISKRQFESEIKLKTILTDGYFGQDGVLRNKRIQSLKHHSDPNISQKSKDSFYQSSKFLDTKNFPLNKKDNDETEFIRDRNIDRLKLLQHYEENVKYKNGFNYFKYTDQEQEDLSFRLKKMDNQLYNLLNPEAERVKIKNVPYNLSSNYDVYDQQKHSESNYYREGITQLSFKVE